MMEGSRCTAAQQFLIHHWEHLLVPICVLAVTLAVGLAAKRLLLRAVARLGGAQ